MPDLLEEREEALTRVLAATKVDALALVEVTANTSLQILEQLILEALDNVRVDDVVVQARCVHFG